MKKSVLAGVLAMCGCALATAAFAQVAQSGPVTVLTLPARPREAPLDYTNARPMPLPAAHVPPPSQGEIMRQPPDPFLLFGRPRFSPGALGSGTEDPVELAPPQPTHRKLSPEGAAPQEFGTSGQPFTTSRVNAQGTKTVNKYPFRAAGKLFFRIGSATYLCSASLIGTGVIVTAAHCVANYGRQQFYSGWEFVPAYNNGQAKYGTWLAQSVFIVRAYYEGTDNCAQYGIVCPDDVAIIVVRRKSGAYPGELTGWFGYGINGYGYNGSGQVLITELGYPASLDGGSLMERDDSQGYVSPTNSNNSVIGSLMTGGSSGGPWLVNLGIPPTLSETAFGTFADHNVVVGVTSWGYTDTTTKQQGASPFTSNNIVFLVAEACTSSSAACR
jgi:hypothetical protein